MKTLEVTMSFEEALRVYALLNRNIKTYEELLQRPISEPVATDFRRDMEMERCLLERLRSMLINEHEGGAGNGNL